MKKTPLKLYHVGDEIIYYLLSYLTRHSRVNFKAQAVSPDNLGQIDNSPESYLLLSITNLLDFYNLHKVINVIRSAFRKIKFNIIVGGSAVDFVNEKDVVEQYREISHICVGKGEEFLKILLEKRLPKGIYHAKDLNLIKPYVVTKRYRLKGSVLLTFNDLRCRWNKCVFCHNIGKSLYPVRSPEEIARNVEYYITECGYRNFLFFDNSMDTILLTDFLEILHRKGYARHKLHFEILGLRADSKIESLRGILDKWRPAPIATGSWGIEFYEQSVLDRYRKGVVLSDIDKSIDFFHGYKIKNYVYLLFGLPQITNAQIKSLGLFIKQSQKKVSEFRIGFFLLTKFLRIYRQKQDFGIKEGRHYTLREYMPEYNLPAIRTSYLDFTSWDEDSQEYISRDATLRKYLTLFKYDKLIYEPYLFFLKDKKLLDLLLIKKTFGVML